ncbi:MAG TPA: conjugative transposon protein TraK [Puia sp.]|nr:conjugative transposon protein TraK [Puia sp.]
MFTKTKNIDTAFRQVRVFSVIVVVGSFSISVFSIYDSHRLVLRSEERIYILAAGKILEAYAADRRDNIPVEARDHVKTFHQLFFTLDPDEKVIASNTSRALYLADGSAKREYDNLKENGYYASLVSGNISQQVEIDSVFVSTNSYPFFFRLTAKEKIIRTTSIVTRSLVTEGYLRTVERSDNNPHGFLIERWSILENRDVKIETR